MSYNGYASSPDERPPRGYQIAPLKGFLPLNDEVTLSTRGQNLPSLIRRNRSGASLSTLDKHERRTSASASPQLHKSRGSDDLEAGIIIGGAWTTGELMERRLSSGMPAAMMTPQMRSQRLIGNSNPRYKWERYWKGEEELKMMKKPIREYYMRCNSLIQHYTFIDRLLDSSLPHNLIQEYHEGVDIPPTIEEESGYTSPNGDLDAVTGLSPVGSAHNVRKVKRTPKNLYKVPEEDTPLLQQPESEPADDDFDPQGSLMPAYTPEEDIDSGSSIVTIAIYLNLVANTVLLILKIIVTIMTSSVSVLASLVDAALDFLSTAIVWTTTRLIASHDLYAYPIGRRRLEPVGVLVFSVIMVTSFFQVALEGFKKMSSGDHTIVQLSIPAIAIMASTVVIKFACWLWCRLIKNSSVQALAQDAMTDVVFNIFSIIFPLIGYYASIWWLDPLGGIFLSFYVIYNWSQTSTEHIRNLTGAAASADERNVLLYLTMRFAKTIKQIQGLQAYHAGDNLNVEVDIVLDEHTALRDSHDLGESLQYVLESVPYVDRAFVHMDYKAWNLPTHMRQHDD